MNAKNALRALLGVTAATVCSVAWSAVSIVIFNADGAGEGFNDPTVVAPVGGNTGTTLGQQRLNAFEYAANLWGAQLDSAVPIVVQANFDPLACTATSAVLGSAGPTFIDVNFAGAPLANTWYHIALANKLVGFDEVPGNPHIATRFNSNLGNAGCLTGSPFYLGLDSPAPVGQVDLIVVLLHEFGHGLGFSAVTNTATGSY
ncbi:MAG: PA domain-containing protein, partial [Burkholderiales bacterium]